MSSCTSTGIFGVAAFVPPGSTIRIDVTPSRDPEIAATGTPQDLERREQNAQQAARVALGTWFPRVMFVLVPAFAGLVALASRRSGLNAFGR